MFVQLELNRPTCLALRKSLLKQHRFENPLQKCASGGWLPFSPPPSIRATIFSDNVGHMRQEMALTLSDKKRVRARFPNGA